MLTELTQAVLACQKGGSGMNELVNRIAGIVYWYPPMRRRWTEDECSEFLCGFYKRIPGMVQRYRYRGSPFEALLKVALQYQMKSFALAMRRRRIGEKVLTNRSFWGANWEIPQYDEEYDRRYDTKYDDSSDDPYDNAASHNPRGRMGERKWEVRETVPVLTPEDAPSAGEKPVIPRKIREKLGIGPDGRIADASTGKRLFLLILRESGRIGKDRLEELLSLLNYPPEWLAEKLQAVQLLNIRLEERRNKCRHRRNQALFNIYSLQEELEETPEARDREEIDRKILREKRAQKTAELALGRIPTSPTHRQLSEILGIPKGTVDSGLYFINRLLSEKPEENDPSGEESG